MWFRLSGGGTSSAGSGADSTDDASPTQTGNHTLTVPSSTGGSEPSRFEKFRRASFRRKSTGHMPTRKRSKSPHFILQADKSTSLEEADEDAEKERLAASAAQERLMDNATTKALKSSGAGSTQSLHRSEVDILLNGPEGEIRALHVLSDPKPEHKKATLKSIKTDPPKRKFYKHFTSSTARRQGSLESAEVPPTASALASLAEFTPKSTLKQRSAAAPTAAGGKYSDDEDYDDDLDTDSTDTDDESSDVDADNLTPKRGNAKEKKILLTDPKYKHNRIEKSSSKTKMSELEKRESLKRSRSARKLAAAERVAAAAAAKSGATAVANAEEAVSSSPLKNKDKRAEKEASKKHSRGHNNLNLHALVKFVMSNKKFLNSEEFTLTRRKSISETASTVITVAATCKPVPIALKYPPDSVVADAPKEHDAKAERNVVLVKKQNLKNSFCEHLNNNNNNNNNECQSHDECMQLSDKEKKKKLKKQKKKSVELEESANREIYKYIAEEDTQKALDAKVKRNSSNSSKSSKSSGNFEDEAFYSCDELEREERARNSRGSGGVGGANSRGGSVSGVEASPNSNTSGSLSSNTSNTLSPTIFVTTDETGTQTTATNTIVKRKTSSPSLTSRVAAKINEKTNNYRNRRAVAAAAAAAANKVAKKQRKGQVSLTTAVGGVGVAAGAGAGKRAEYYKQLSVGEQKSSKAFKKPEQKSILDCG